MGHRRLPSCAGIQGRSPWIWLDIRKPTGLRVACIGSREEQKCDRDHGGEGLTLKPSVLSAYDRLLLAAVSPETFRPESIAPLLEERTFSWQQASRVASINRVASFVSVLLGDDLLARLVDDSVRAGWRSNRMLQAARVEQALKQTREIGDQLGRADVTPLLYKGLDFHARYYSPPCPRTFKDVDIIVHRNEVETAVGALLAAGYRPLADSLSLSYYYRFHLHAAYYHPNHARPVELHWALDSPFAGLPDSIPLLFEGAERVEEFGPNLLRPSAVDALALMARHFDKHLGLCATLGDSETRLKSVIDAGGLVWVLDVLQWMRGQESIPAAAPTLRRIRELGAERALVVALRLAHDVDPTALPQWARELALRLPHGRPLLTRLVYPDLSTGKAPTREGQRIRSFLFKLLPGLVFQRVRVLEALLPRFRVPGVARPPTRTRVASLLRRVALIGANLLAVGFLRLQRRRASERGRKGKSAL